MPVPRPKPQTLFRIAVVVLVPLLLVPLFDWAFDHLFARYVTFGIALTGFVSWPFLVAAKYNQLVAQAGTTDSRTAVRKMKLIAEICAGLALVSFLSVYFRWGEQFDRQNDSARFSFVGEASTLLHPILTSAYCNEKPYRNYVCEETQNELQQLATAVVGNDEKQVEKYLRDITVGLRAGRLDDLSAEQQQRVQEAVSKLDSIAIDGWLPSFVFTSLQLYSFILGLMAVSSKTAVALFELHDTAAKKITLTTLGKSMSKWVTLRWRWIHERTGKPRAATARTRDCPSINAEEQPK